VRLARGQKQSLAAEFNRLSSGGWERLEREFPGVQLAPYITSVSSEFLEASAAATLLKFPKSRVLESLRRYVLRCPPGFTAERILEHIRNWSFVERAAIGPRFSLPSIDTSDDWWSVNQEYLNSGGRGIDARTAWNFRGVSLDGSGQTFCDIEQGWQLNHEDLPAGLVVQTGSASHPLAGASTNSGAISHGTAVLGVVVSQDNNYGCVGIAPGTSDIRLVPTGDDSPGVGNALAWAAANLPKGSIVLIEQQIDPPYPNWSWGDQKRQYLNFHLPVEADPDVLIDIQRAVASGLIVVEPAGNGNHDLDEYIAKLDQDYDADVSHQSLSRRRGGYNDSGAILVGASTPIKFTPSFTLQDGRVLLGPYFETHRRWDGGFNNVGSNFGSRVNCFGWGEYVASLRSYTPPMSRFEAMLQILFRSLHYRKGFSGTSSASAIVAGAALLAQHGAESFLGRRIDPEEMRQWLSDTDTGTPSRNPAIDRIGVMPDLMAILSKRCSPN
jgi:subtilisin family serine protease